jgi:large subunit ribosomal protein L2
VGADVAIGDITEIKSGNVMPLRNIPEGTNVYNIESNPGDGGKFVRASGTFARILSKMRDRIIVLLPSNKKKEFRPDCKAVVGIIAGGGRTEKPFLKAGNKYYAMKAKNKLWPITSGTSMNSVDHPFGGSSSGHKGRPTQSSRHAPPGRKVGKIAPRRTGRRNS